MRRTTLQTIGYICESLVNMNCILCIYYNIHPLYQDPDILTTQQKNNILTAIIDGARREEQE